MSTSASSSLGSAGSDHASLTSLVVRAAIGGVLMGLANLVPGISGGTMLLAAGVYPVFINSIAELSTFRFHTRSIIALGTIAGSAALAILLLAGLMKSLVVEQRWIMYSIFIGLTLGGVPLVWRLARPASASLIAGAATAFALMVVMQLGADPSAGGEASTTLLFFSGLAGASAMILPGVSGGYLLLLLGQYEPILGAIDLVKQGLVGGQGLAVALSAMGVVIPVGLGVVVGIAGVSNLLKWLLDRFEKPTLGALLGLLLGAVVGLWPFQSPIPPQPGDLIDGEVVSADHIGEIDVEDWRVEIFSPTPGQVASSLGLISLGLAATLLIARVGDGNGSSDD
jgi:putative membrane protein